MLFVSAANNKNGKVCKGIEISFNEEGNSFFVDEKGVIAFLKEFGSIKGTEIRNIDLNALEARLKKDRWIANAELFFDNRQVLQVLIEEKEPVARIFTSEGSSFYIDSACKKLPLSEKLTARIPMFTNFPSDRSILSKPDSVLLASVKELAMFIQADEFWKAQVAQVDITPEGFEMIPTVGSHVVALGKDGRWQQKFDRLFSFYKQVWTKVGFEKYDKIDVQFSGQVVTTAKGAKPAIIDSARARKAYENLLAEVKEAAGDTVAESKRSQPLKDAVKAQNKAVPKIIAVTAKAGTTVEKKELAKPVADKIVATRQPVVKKEALPQHAKMQALKTATIAKRSTDKQEPKAVMKASRH